MSEMSKKAQETEWNRRRNLPYVEVRRMFTKRSTDTVLTLLGKEIGSRTELLKRGKTVTVLYVLPAMG